MKTYEVDVEGRTYEVDAPDPDTAWQWATKHHRAEQVKLEEAGKAKGGEYKIGEAGFADAAKQVADETGVAGRFLQGAGESFDRYALGAKGLVTDLSPEDQQRLAQNRTMTEAGGAPALAGQVAGDIAISGPAMAAGASAAPLVARALPRAAALASSVPGRVAGAVVPNAAMGALSSPEDRGTGALYGGVGGAAGSALTRTAGGLVRPFIGREGRELIEQGIQPTPGQAVGGWAGRFEEKLGSVPGVGDIISHGRNRAIGEFNEALTGRTSQQLTGQRGLPRAAGRALGETGDEALLNLRGQIGKVYEDVLAQVPRLRIEPELIVTKLNQVANDPALGLSDANAKRLLDYVNKHIIERGADITGQVAKQIESDMGKVVSSMKGGASTAEERAFGEALERVHQFWRDGVAASLPNDAQRAALQNANQAWRAFRPLDEAAATAGSQLRESQGVFTPRVLRSALAKGDKSQSDNVLRNLQRRPVAQATNPYEYAASMSRAGRTLGDRVPDSGTPSRLLASAGVGGAGVADLATTLGVGTAALGGTAALYSRRGAELLTQGAFPATREAVERWLATQGVPPETIPMLVEQTLAAYARTQQPQRPLAKSLMQRNGDAARLPR